ncbi:methyltransferase [Amycolatopsis orientalis]|uniref:methyltransferase n=1 Tax=Amycolatopsis orientalis TaxID=31958 RepID=UPI001F3041FA|nr:methyltransferase [Amycolatopsis orientalis]
MRTSKLRPGTPDAGAPAFRGPVSPIFFLAIAGPCALTLEVLVVSMVPWAVGAVGLMAGPALVRIAERAVGSPLTAPGLARAVMPAVVSTVTAVLCWAGWFRFGVTPIWLAWCWACALGCGLVLTDLRCRRLPFPLVAAFAGGGVIALFGAAALEERWSQLGFACGAAVVVFALAALVQAWAPNHTGGGDTALYGALALYLGWFGLEGLLRGLLMVSGLTAVVALVVAVCSRRMNSRFPAGPPLLAGALVSMLVA